MEHETKSVVSDSDTDHSCMDLLSEKRKSIPPEIVREAVDNVAAADDNASLSDYIVSSYVGGRDQMGSYDGEGQVQFSGGNIYQVFGIETNHLKFANPAFTIMIMQIVLLLDCCGTSTEKHIAKIYFCILLSITLIINATEESFCQ